MPIQRGPVVALPKDAILVELRAEAITFETRKCLLPGTLVSMRLVMEGQALPLELPTADCQVVDRDRLGYIYRSRVPLDGLAEGDQHLIQLFIAKGRGAPELTRP